MCLSQKKATESSVGCGKATAVWPDDAPREREVRKLAFVRCMRCVLPSDEVKKALRSVFLQWAAAGSAENERDVKKERVDGSAVAASE